MEIFLFIFPLLSFLLFQFFNQKIRSEILYSINILLFGFSFLLSLYIFIKILNLDKDLPLFFFTLYKLENLFIDLSLRFDLLVSCLLVLVTFIGLLILLYSISVSKNYQINFQINSYLSFSIFSMLVLITSNNLIQLFLGWYLIILSSYMISNISENRFDSRNIFFENRVSDLCFFLSLYFIYVFSNSINFDIIFKSFQIIASKETISNITFSSFYFVIFILLFSFLLRFRQFYIANSRYDLLNFNSSTFSFTLYGLYFPVGLFFILRFLTLTHTSLNYLNLILMLGSILSFIFLILLVRSYKLNKLILYIASAQFGILLIGLSLKLYNAVIFHFITSTLSLLIISLSFGIITNKLNNEQDIRKMGHLIFKCPYMFLFVLIGFISLLGIPYFSGYYSNQLFLSQSFLINKESYFLILTYCICYTFIISYISFKIILVVFLGQNNCNIHLYNKIEEGSYNSKLILFVLSVLIIFSGWYFNNLFSGNFGENIWRLVLIGGNEYSLNHKLNDDQLLFETRNIVCYVGIFLAFLNYLIVPKLGDNLKIKNNKLFKFYLKSFTSYDFNR